MQVVVLVFPYQSKNNSENVSNFATSPFSLNCDLRVTILILNSHIVTLRKNIPVLHN